MLKVKKIVTNILSSNMYVLFEERYSIFWIIDIGDADELKKNLPLNSHVEGIFITHGHFDHIAGINKFITYWPHAKIYTSNYGYHQLFSDKANFSFYHGESILFDGPKNEIIILEDGKTIDIFNNCRLNVIATPGHCPSCLTYYTDEYIFTGDSYIPGAKVVTKLPKGNKIMAERSFQKILALSESRIVCSGHDLNKWQSFIL